MLEEDTEVKVIEVTVKCEPDDVEAFDDSYSPADFDSPDEIPKVKIENLKPIESSGRNLVVKRKESEVVSSKKQKKSLNILNLKKIRSRNPHDCPICGATLSCLIKLRQHIAW